MQQIAMLLEQPAENIQCVYKHLRCIYMDSGSQQTNWQTRYHLKSMLAKLGQQRIPARVTADSIAVKR